MTIPSSSGTCDEIMPIEDTNHTFSSNNPTQIAISRNVNNRIEPTSKDYDDNNNNRSSMAEMLSKLIIANLNSLDKISKKIRKYEDRIKDMFEEFNKLEQEGGTEHQFGELKRNIIKLKQLISANHEDDREESDPHRRQSSNKVNADNTLKNQALKRTLPYSIACSGFTKPKHTCWVRSSFHSSGSTVRVSRSTVLVGPADHRRCSFSNSSH